MARKTLRQIYAQAERLSEANWRRKNTWETSTLSRRAKQSREGLLQGRKVVQFSSTDMAQ